MGDSNFLCPVTGRQIDPGIEEPEAIQSDAVRFVALHVRCPHCGEHHEIKIDDDALNAAA
jgi:phage terminase large subunit GpA-like protein